MISLINLVLRFVVKSLNDIYFKEEVWSLMSHNSLTIIDSSIKSEVLPPTKENYSYLSKPNYLSLMIPHNFNTCRETNL